MNESTSGTDGVREPQSEVAHTWADRDLASAQWLLSAAPGTAREWATDGFADLRCGNPFTTVSLLDLYVHALAGTSQPGRVAVFLREHVGGPVFFDTRNHRYHALVPPGAARLWHLSSVPGTSCAGVGKLVTVPMPGRARPDTGPVHWVVPMDGPGALCSPVEVAQIAHAGYARVILRERAEHE